MIDKYHSFTEKGFKEFPDNKEISELMGDNIEPILFLDSCVCLNIVKVIDYKRKAANANLNKVINLKKYISINNLKIRPTFGLIELSYEDGNYNVNKYWDFWHRIKYFEEMPLKHFLNFKFDFFREFHVIETPRINLESTFKSLEYCIGPLKHRIAL